MESGTIFASLFQIKYLRILAPFPLQLEHIFWCNENLHKHFFLSMLFYNKVFDCFIGENFQDLKCECLVLSILVALLGGSNQSHLLEGVGGRLFWNKHPVRFCYPRVRDVASQLSQEAVWGGESALWDEH